jgi:hypothetical protein
MAQRVGGREPMQPKPVREAQSRLGTTHLEYSERRQSQARLSLQPYCSLAYSALASLGVLGWEVNESLQPESLQPNLCNLNVQPKRA